MTEVKIKIKVKIKINTAGKNWGAQNGFVLRLDGPDDTGGPSPSLRVLFYKAD